MFRILLVSLSLILGAASLQASPPEVNPARAVVIAGVIANGNVLGLIPVMQKLSKDGTGEPIDMIISSPGGDIVTGFIFVNGLDAIRASGTTVRCFVPTLAASMAFQILVHCDERYTLDHSFLLWHGVRVILGGGGFLGGGGTPITAKQAADLADDLGRADSLILYELGETLGLSTEVIRHHFDLETLHIGQQLAAMAPGFITSYPSIPGLMEVVTDPKTPHGGQDRAVSFKPGDIVYMKHTN